MSAASVVVGLVVIVLIMLISLQMLFLNASKWLSRVKRAVPKSDRFSQENHYSWDYVLVFKVFTDEEIISDFQKENSLKKIMILLSMAGLETSLFYSVQQDEIFMKIRAPLDVLKAEAARIDYKLLLDEKALQRRLEHGLKELYGNYIWRPIRITNSNVSRYRPYSFIYGRYTLDPDLQDIYCRYSNRSIFRGSDRIKLLTSRIKAPRSAGGAGLNLRELLQLNAIMTYYPLHDEVELDKLRSQVLAPFGWLANFPFNDIKDYFGEKVGLYYQWMFHYTTSLVIPALFGLVIFVVQAIQNRPTPKVLVAFAIFMSLWATVLLKRWRKKQARIAMEWGTTGYETIEKERPEYRGDAIADPVSGGQTIYFPLKKYRNRTIRASLVVAVMITIVIGMVSCSIFLNVYLTSGSRKDMFTWKGVQLGVITACLVNVFEIQVMTRVYPHIARRLNDYENHRTDSLYEDALIVKMFLFEFVNNYSSAFYIAFVKRYAWSEDACTNKNCLTELGTVLATLFLSHLALRSASKIILPIIRIQHKTRSELVGVEAGKSLTPVEAQYVLEQGPSELLFNQYLELCIQYGFAVLFAVAFPFAPLVACASNYLEIRVNTWKVCQMSRRLEPTIADNIGRWYDILVIMSYMAVVTNIGIICFTSDLWTSNRFQIFILIEHLIFVINICVSYFLPEVSLTVDIQLRRQKFIASKVLDKLRDDVDDDPAFLDNFRQMFGSGNDQVEINLTDNQWFFEQREGLKMVQDYSSHSSLYLVESSQNVKLDPVKRTEELKSENHRSSAYKPL